MIVLVYIKKADFVCFLDRLKMCLGVNNLPDFGIRNKIRFFFVENCYLHGWEKVVSVM